MKKGFKMSLNSRKKMSLAKKGFTPWNKGLKGVQAGIKHPMYGKHHSSESKEKNRLAHLGKEPWNKSIKTGLVPKTAFKRGYSPTTHWNWQGGVTPLNEKVRKSFEYRLWKHSVFERDDYTCQICLIRGGDLQADHIKPFAYFPELRLKVSNGRTLCKKCHRNTDTYGRQRNNTYDATLANVSCTVSWRL